MLYRQNFTVISADAFHDYLSTLQRLSGAVSIFLVLVFIDFIISDHAGCGNDRSLCRVCLTWWWWVVLK